MPAQLDAALRRLVRIDLREAAARRAVRGEAAAVGDQAERRLADVAADVVEDHVGLAGRREPVAGVGVDHRVGAELADAGELGRVATGGHDARGTAGAGELDEQDPEAAAGADDEHAVAGPDPGAVRDRDRGRPVVQQRRGVARRQAVGHR